MKANWNKVLGRVGWHADVGPFHLAVTPCNLSRFGLPSRYRGLCTISVGEAEARTHGVPPRTIWELDCKEQNLDLPEQMALVEKELERRLQYTLETFSWDLLR